MKKTMLLLLGLVPSFSGAAVLRVPALPASYISAPAVRAPALAAASLPAQIPRAPVLASASSMSAAPVQAAARVAAPRAEITARLQRRFAALDGTFPLPAASPAARVRRNIRAELLHTARAMAEADAGLLETVAEEADRALGSIQRRLDAKDIDPSLELRSDPTAAPVTPQARAIKVGVYPVAADPFHWGHLIVALRAVGDLGVDKVVFVLAGDDPRKPAMTPVLDRHPMGREVLKQFAPFFDYSPIAVGTQLDGETNIFRILALNYGLPVTAWYMVGDDHYRLTDKNGKPDTLPKLEANLSKNLGHDSALHQLKVAFIERERPTETVPTSLEVQFIEHAGFDASSTQVRKGRHDLIPYAALKYGRRRGLYGLGASVPK